MRDVKKKLQLPEGNVTYFPVKHLASQVPVVEYARLSDSTLNSGLSLERQISDCSLARALRPDDVLIARYIDDMSGTVDDRERPGLRKMLEDAMSGKFKRIYLAEASRAARVSSAIERIFDVCRSKDIEVIAADSGHLDPFVAGIKVLVAREELKTFFNRVQGGKRAHFERGHAMWPAPWGFLLADGWDQVGNKPMKFLKPDPALAEHVVWLFQAVADGLTGPEICKTLMERRVRPPRAEAWNPNTIMSAIVPNPAYKGTRRAGYYKVFKNPLSGKRELVEGPEANYRWQHIEPLVTEELWDAAQAKRAEIKAAQRKRAGAQERLWTGRLTCECGRTCTMVADSRFGPERSRWVCWGSRDRKVDGQNERVCTRPLGVPDEDLSRGMLEAVQRFLMDPRASAEFERHQNLEIEQAQKGLGHSLASAEKNLKRLKAEKIAVFDKLIVNDCDDDERKYLEQKRTRIKEEIDRLEKIVASAKSGRAKRVVASQLASYAESLSDLLKDLPYDLKQIKDPETLSAVRKFKAMFKAVIKREPRARRFQLEIQGSLHAIAGGTGMPSGVIYVYDANAGTLVVEPFDGERDTDHSPLRIRYEGEVTFLPKGPVLGRHYPTMAKKKPKVRLT
jgi:DNA invertase Pin-like site-specific DNA recombinase